MRREEQESNGVATSCCWNDHGYQCGAPGVRSETTSGGGQWFCRRHWHIRAGMPDPGHPVSRVRSMDNHGIGPREDGESEMRYAKRASAFCREHIANIGKVAGKSKDWAERIVDRYVDGEPMADISLRWACEVLRVDLEQLRRTVQRQRRAA